MILIRIEYDIVFSERDQEGSVAYHETCRLIGDDTDVPVTSATAATTSCCRRRS